MSDPTARLIRGYLSKAQEKLDAAVRLQAAGFFADAVSRAYYAAFFAAHAALLAGKGRGLI